MGKLIRKAWAKILGITLIAVGLVDIAYYMEWINFGLVEPGSMLYVGVLFSVGILLVWKSPVGTEIPTLKKDPNIFVDLLREKLIGVLVLLLLFSEYYLATVPDVFTFLGDNIFPWVGITNSLGHGILTLLLGIIAFYDPYKKRVHLTPYG